MKYAWVMDQYIFQAFTLLFSSVICMLKGRREAEQESRVVEQE